MNMLKRILSLLTLAAVCGCSTVVYHGGVRSMDSSAVRLFVPPFNNATDDEHAGRALTELTTSALLQKGIKLVQTEQALIKSRAENAAGLLGVYTEAASSVGATHLLIGTVHEYKYKTDLDGDPAVGVTMRLVDVKDGKTLWQGSSAKVDAVFASLSTAAQHAVRELVRQMPLGASSK